MKKMLALIVCLCLLSCAALAELTVPTPPPSQSELQMNFLTNLFRFFFAMDDDQEALSFDLTENDQTLASALFQETEGILDVDGNVGGLPVRAELTDDALLIDYDGQLYKLPISEFLAAAPGTTSGTEGGSVDTSQEFMKILGLFRDTVIVPSISMEEVDGSQHIGIDVSADRLIAFGDAIFGNEQYQALFSMVSGEFNWPEVRAQLESGQLPFSLKGDITMGDTGLSGKGEGTLFGTMFSSEFAMEGANVNFSGECDGVHKVSGSYDLANGAFEYHSDSGEMHHLDVVYVPEEEGWTMDVDAVRETKAMTLNIKDDAEVFGFQMVHTDSGAQTDCSFTVDKATRVIDGTLRIEGGVTAVLAGAPTDDGYHATLDVTQDGNPVHTVDFTLVDNDDLVAVELNSTREGGDLIWSASFVAAKETGAYTFRYDGADGSFADSNGVINGGNISSVTECGQDGVVNLRFEMNRVDDDSVYAQSYTGYYALTGNGDLSKLFESTFTFDKETNGFFGSYRIPGQYTDIQFQGICGDSVFKLRVDAQGRNSGRLDLSWIKGEEGSMGAIDFATVGLSMTGDVLWSPYMKSLSAVVNNQNRIKATLSQDENGMPQEIQISGNLYGMPGMMMRPASFSLIATREQLLVRVDGRTTAIRGGFRDGHTYVLDIVQNEGRRDELHYALTATADPKQLTLRFDGLTTDDYIEARLAHADRAELESLAGRDDAVVLTQEMLQQMLEESQAPQEAPAGATD